MADVSQVITLGIGTPADIEHFVLFGLNATGAVTVEHQLITLGIGTPADIEHFILFGLNVSGFTGVVPVTLHERMFGSGTLDDRYILDGNLYKRWFGTATLDDKP